MLCPSELLSHTRPLGPDPQPSGAEAGLQLITGAAYGEDRSNGGFQLASARARKTCHNRGKLQVVNDCSHSPEEERSREMCSPETVQNPRASATAMLQIPSSPKTK